jgi:hypothetical protein
MSKKELLDLNNIRKHFSKRNKISWLLKHKERKRNLNFMVKITRDSSREP